MLLDLRSAGTIGCRRYGIRARGRSGTPQGPQRATGGAKRADRSPDSLSSPEHGIGKRLRPYFLNGFSDDHVKRYKKRPIYRLITSPKGTLQALIFLHRYNRDTVNRFPGGYLRPYQQKLEAKRVTGEYFFTIIQPLFPAIVKGGALR